MIKWSDDMIKEYFDTHWDVTIHTLSILSGRTKAEIKNILLEKG